MVSLIASVEELQARLDWTLPDNEIGVAEGALRDLSDDARYYGLSGWDSVSAPEMVKSLVLRAAARFMRNFEGFAQSRAGDETVIWAEHDRAPDTAEFSRPEIDRLRELANGRPAGLVSVGTYAWQTKYVEGDLMVWDGRAWMPWVAAKDADWYRRVMG